MATMNSTFSSDEGNPALQKSGGEQRTAKQSSTSAPRKKAAPKKEKPAPEAKKEEAAPAPAPEPEPAVPSFEAPVAESSDAKDA